MNRIDGLSVADLVTNLDGVTIVGDPAVVCQDALPLCDAVEGCVTMINDLARCTQLDRSGAAAVVTSKYSDQIRCTQIIVADVYEAFTAIVKQFRHVAPSIVHAAIDSNAQIAPTATIGVGTRVDAGVVIGAGVTIGTNCHLMAGVVVMDHATIGDNCSLYPHVVVYEHSRIENEVIIHSGSVIGAHGFGYQLVNGRHVSRAQLGFVHIESCVEIGANVTIDRGTYGATRIGEGTKIDNLVQIAHNCQIGKHNLICSQVGLAGSCKTGDYVILAGQVGIADHITIGNHAIVGAQAGVMENLEGKQTYLGSPATPRREQMQILATQRKLPEMRKELRNLRREVDSYLTTEVENTSVHQSGEVLEPVAGSDESEDQPHCLQFKRPAA